MKIEEMKAITYKFLEDRTGFAYSSGNIAALTGLMSQEVQLSLRTLHIERKVAERFVNGIVYWTNAK